MALTAVALAGLVSRYGLAAAAVVLVLLVVRVALAVSDGELGRAAARRARAAVGSEARPAAAEWFELKDVAAAGGSGWTDAAHKAALDGDAAYARKDFAAASASYAEGLKGGGQGLDKRAAAALLCRRAWALRRLAETPGFVASVPRPLVSLRQALGLACKDAAQALRLLEPERDLRWAERAGEIHLAHAHGPGAAPPAAERRQALERAVAYLEPCAAEGAPRAKRAAALLAHARAQLDKCEPPAAEEAAVPAADEPAEPAATASSTRKRTGASVASSSSS